MKLKVNWTKVKMFLITINFICVIALSFAAIVFIWTGQTIHAVLAVQVLTFGLIFDLAKRPIHFTHQSEINLTDPAMILGIIHILEAKGYVVLERKNAKKNVD